MDFNLVAWFKLQRFDDDGGKAERKTVSLFGDLHTVPPRYAKQIYLR
jgi:hypothetical protein